jgi:hypothetical protein
MVLSGDVPSNCNLASFRHARFFDFSTKSGKTGRQLISNRASAQRRFRSFAGWRWNRRGRPISDTRPSHLARFFMPRSGPWAIASLPLVLGSRAVDSSCDVLGNGPGPCRTGVGCDAKCVAWVSHTTHEVHLEMLGELGRARLTGDRERSPVFWAHHTVAAPA